MGLKSEEIRKVIIEQITAHPRDIARLIADQFRVSRQWASNRLRRMVAEGILVARGDTRGREYRLALLAQNSVTLPVAKDVEEHAVWTSAVAPFLGGIPENVQTICHFGTTEMVNNVIEHSESPRVTVSVERTAASIRIDIRDAGIGVFRKIKEACGLDDERQAIFELTKGKLTTDPAHHTGEGIFFTARMFDSFTVAAGGLALVSSRRAGEDWLFETGERPAEESGTLVRMEIRPDSSHTAQETFSRFASERDDFGFTATRVVVNLARSGPEQLLSRSQARRVLARVEKFRRVTFDFSGVESIGPAFADEIFRVFATEHPDIRIDHAAAVPVVEAMIRRALAARSSSG
jgi:anti-sigma regulatory factor (Ser/Thr protein kinase)